MILNVSKLNFEMDALKACHGRDRDFDFGFGGEPATQATTVRSEPFLARSEQHAPPSTNPMQ